MREGWSKDELHTSYDLESGVGAEVFVRTIGFDVLRVQLCRGVLGEHSCVEVNARDQAPQEPGYSVLRMRFFPDHYEVDDLQEHAEILRDLARTELAGLVRDLG